MSGRDEQALLEMNNRRESWCQVEGGPRQSWDRAQRKHYRKHLKTGSSLDQALKGQNQTRTSRLDHPAPAPLAQRRHYEDSYKSHLV
ncbi:spermatogenesis-associated protein 45 [Eucyclogobius newberryi]|uniref:spermatogenesis-associated protein 45 n=1 Tax=Eucyclogobius newberryi TaxID=166745 RepID=UPI003B5B6624